MSFAYFKNMSLADINHVINTYDIYLVFEICFVFAEISFQEGSVYNSELNLTNPDAECQTDPLEEVDYSHNEIEHNLCSEVTEELKICDTNYKAQVEVGTN